MRKPGELSRRSLLLAGISMPAFIVACTPSGPSTPFDPASVDHIFGTTTVSKRPSRVVALGRADADCCVRLGVSPVSMMQDANTPWFRVQAKDLEVEIPPLFNPSNEVLIRDIKSMRPDLVLATDFSLNREQYDAISDFAPVIANPVRDFQLEGYKPWAQNLEMIAAALGESNKVSGISDNVQKVLSASALSYPDLLGTSVVALNLSASLGAGLAVYSPRSIMVAGLVEFGLVPGVSAETLATIGSLSEVNSSTYSVPVSQAPDLQSQIIVAGVFDSKNDDELDRALSQLSATKAGTSDAIVPLQGDLLQVCVTPSPTAIEWMAENIAPDLAKASYLAKL